MARKQESPEAQILERCPACGGPLESGFLWGGLGWYRERPSDAWGPLHAGTTILQVGIGGEHSAPAQHCTACGLYAFRRT